MVTTTERIRILWGSGFVNRWHSHPDPRLRNSGDTTAAHAQRVAILVSQLPTNARLTHDDMLEAIIHDAPECYTGDVPYRAKRDRQVNTDDAEDAWWKELGFDAFYPSPLLKLADALDAILFVKHVAPDLLDRDDWQDCINHTLGWAKTLGLRDIVEELING